MREQFKNFFIIMFLYDFCHFLPMYRYYNSVGTEITSKNLVELRKKAIAYLSRNRIIDTVDIFSDRQGYMGNVHKTKPHGICVWSPANGRRLDYPGQIYLGSAQSWLNKDGSLYEKVGYPLEPYDGGTRKLR